MDVQLAKVIQEITNDILKGARDIMDSDVGINQKVGINTLHNSNLYNQIKQSWKEISGEEVLAQLSLMLSNHSLKRCRMVSRSSL